MKLSDVDDTVNEGIMDYLKDNPWYHIGSSAVGHAPYASANTAKELLAKENFTKSFLKAATAVLMAQTEIVRDAVKQQEKVDNAEDEQMVQQQVQIMQQAGQTVTPQIVKDLRQKIKNQRLINKQKTNEGFEQEFDMLMEQEIPQSQPKYISDILKQFLAKYLQSSLGNISPYANQLYPFCDQIGSNFVKGQPYQGILKELGETIYTIMMGKNLAKQTVDMDNILRGNPQLLEIIKAIQKIKRGKDLDEIIKAATEQKKLSY